TFLLDRSQDLGGDLGDGGGDFLRGLGLFLPNYGLPVRLRLLRGPDSAPIGAVSDPALGQLFALLDTAPSAPLADPMTLNPAPALSHAETSPLLDQYFKKLVPHQSDATTSDPLHALPRDTRVLDDLFPSPLDVNQLFPR